jgi:hypothetical protein
VYKGLEFSFNFDDNSNLKVYINDLDYLQFIRESSPEDIRKVEFVTHYIYEIITEDMRSSEQ